MSRFPKSAKAKSDIDGSPPGAVMVRECPSAGPLPGHGGDLALVICFLAIIAAVPIAQIGLELARHERVQFTDVFRYRPTARNLRQFEETLKEKSWTQQKLRPGIQWLFFTFFRDTGNKGVLGRNHWLFYRPDIGYLVEPDRLEADHSVSKWVGPSGGFTRRDSVERAIVRFCDQLQERGIRLVVVPIPGKPSVYPDQVTNRALGHAQDLRSPTRELLGTLRSLGVATVDLFTLFSQVRPGVSAQRATRQLYLARDTHWTPGCAQLAAEAIAARLRELGWTAATTNEFRLRRARVVRWGDVLDMMQIPGLRQALAPEIVECEQVLDPNLGLLVPANSDRPGTYRYPGQRASVLVLGDSFSRIYQYAEPRSLGDELIHVDGSVVPGGDGQGTKRLLPGSAGFISHLAFALKTPVDAIYSDGGASTDVRRKLSTNPEILEGKKVVIWEFVERDIALGQEGWEDVPLPRKLD